MEWIEDNELSDTLTETEERHKRYIARQEESADQERVIGRGTDSGDPASSSQREEDSNPLEQVVSWIDWTRVKRSRAYARDEEYGNQALTVTPDSAVVGLSFLHRPMAIRSTSQGGGEPEQKPLGNCP